MSSSKEPVSTDSYDSGDGVKIESTASRSMPTKATLIAESSEKHYSECPLVHQALLGLSGFWRRRQCLLLKKLNQAASSVILLVVNKLDRSFIQSFNATCLIKRKVFTIATTGWGLNDLKTAIIEVFSMKQAMNERQYQQLMLANEILSRAKPVTSSKAGDPTAGDLSPNF